MSHSKSAAKRVRQNERRRLRNRTLRSAAKTQAKKVEAALGKGDLETARKSLALAMKRYDKASKTGAIHKNNADRHKSLLARQLRAAERKATAGA